MNLAMQFVKAAITNTIINIRLEHVIAAVASFAVCMVIFAGCCGCEGEKITYYKHDKIFYAPADQADQFKNIFKAEDITVTEIQYEEFTGGGGDHTYKGLKPKGYVYHLTDAALANFALIQATTSDDIRIR